jgi:Flp pilus assembly protein CpaB
MGTGHRASWAQLIRRHRRPLAGLAAAASITTLGLALQPAADPTRSVVVAAADLPAGRSLNSNDLRTARVAAGVLPADTYAETSDLVGEVLAAPLVRGEAVGAHRLTAAPDWTIPPDTSPLPVRFADASAARLLRPGQHVDVLAASGPGLDDAGFAAAELIAADVLVLAVIDPEGSGGMLDSRSVGPDSSALVLLAVDRVSALAIAGGQARANLAFMMRPRSSES